MLTQAKLYLDGSQFWAVLEEIAGRGIISFFRNTMYPLRLCPNMLNPKDFVAGSTTVSSQLEIGTKGTRISRGTLMQKLAQIRDKGDPPLVLRIEYLNSQTRGILLRLPITLGQLLQAASHGKNLLVPHPLQK